MRAQGKARRRGNERSEASGRGAESQQSHGRRICGAVEGRGTYRASDGQESRDLALRAIRRRGPPLRPWGL